MWKTNHACDLWMMMTKRQMVFSCRIPFSKKIPLNINKSRLWADRKLRSFTMCTKMLEVFHQSVVGRAIFFVVICWSSSIRARNTNRLDKNIKKAGCVISLGLDNVQTMVERRMLYKLMSTMDNVEHPLHHTPHTGQTTEHFLKKAMTALLLNGQIQEILPLTSHCTINQNHFFSVYSMHFL